MRLSLAPRGATLHKARGLSCGGRGGNKGSTCLGGVRLSPRPPVRPASSAARRRDSRSRAAPCGAGGFEAGTRRCAFPPPAWSAPTRGAVVPRSSRGREWPRPGGETERECGGARDPERQPARRAPGRGGAGERAAETRAGAGRGRGRGVCRTLDRSCEPPPRRSAPSPGAAARIAEGLRRSVCACRGSLPAGKAARTGAVRAAGSESCRGGHCGARPVPQWKRGLVCGAAAREFGPRRCGRRGAARSPARG